MPKLVIGDGYLGIWHPGCVEEADWQRRWSHRLVNVLGEIPTKRKPEARAMLRSPGGRRRIPFILLLTKSSAGKFLCPR